jgi:branched-chain amino acid transport system permease protein
MIRARKAAGENLPQLIAVVAGVTLLALVPVLIETFYVFVATRVLIFALLAMALNLVFGFGGMPSLGHAAFFGTGGYVVALGLTRGNWDFPTILLVTVIAGLVIGAVFGLLTIRTQGIYLLLLTLALAQSFWALAFEQVQWTRGDTGIAGISRESLPFGRTTEEMYWFTLLISAILVMIMWLWTRSPVGRALVGAREGKSRIEALGYRTWSYRVGAFSLSGAISAIAGMLLVYVQGIATPDLLNWPVSAEVLVMTILGGAGTLLGPALGALVVIALQEFVSTYTERWTTVLGVVFILTMLLLPQGLTGLMDRLRRHRPHEPKLLQPEPARARDDITQVGT